MQMLEKVKKDLGSRVNDDKLAEALFFSFQKISEDFAAQKAVELFQNTGLFVESVLRMAEHFVLGGHTPIGNKFDVDASIEKLKKSSGCDGLRIHAARLSRSIYDFRSRKNGVHLKAIDPKVIDANLIFNISTWILIEILRESGIKNPEETIKLLFTRKVPLVQTVDGLLRTTNPKLLGTHRILILLYSAPEGLTEDELFEGTKRKIGNKNHLQKNLKNMDGNDLIHKRTDGKWVLFGQGFVSAEELIAKFS